MPGSIVDFYTGANPDHRGRYLRDIQQWPNDRLEAVHDFIQWLFPLPDRSPVNPLAPTIDRTTVEAFAASPDLRHSLRESFVRMLRFYGFELRLTPAVTITRTADFAARAENWLTPSNHNHLRITRILKCLATLGLREEAQAFFGALSILYEEERRQSRPRITATTFEFWRAAAN